MKSRQEIKWLAKQAFQNRYWPCVGALALYGVIVYALGLTGIGTLILGGPLLIGFNFYFVNVFMHGGCEIGGAFSKAFEDFGRKLGGYLWMQLFVFLWALIPYGVILVFALILGVATAVGGSIAAAVLAILILIAACIGGSVLLVIKVLSYSLTTYILCDCPNVRAQDALTLSKRLMRGHKGELFVFNLSFLGWDILSVFTLGLLNIFYVGPYKRAALAGWYLELREQALREGTVTTDELNGALLRENAPRYGNGNSYGNNPNGYNPNGYTRYDYAPNGYNPYAHDQNTASGGYGSNGYAQGGQSPYGSAPNGGSASWYNQNNYSSNNGQGDRNDQNFGE